MNILKIHCLRELIFLSLLLSSSSTADADNRSALQLTLGAEPHTQTLAAQGADSTLQVGHLVLRAGCAKAAFRAQALVVEAQHVALIEASGCPLREAWLVGLKGKDARTLWQGHLAWTGDLGERRSDAFYIQDIDGDKKEELVVGYLDERIQLCGSPVALMRAQRLDAHTLSFKPAVLSRLPAVPQAVQAQSDAPFPEAHPWFTARALGASSMTADNANADAALDSSDFSAWSPKGDAPREFITYAPGSDWSIEWVAVKWAKSSKSGGPPRLWLTTDQVVLEVTAPKNKSETFWIRLPPAAQKSPVTKCVSLILESPSAIAEIQTFTSLEGPNGETQRWVSELNSAGGTERSESALRALKSPIVPRLVALWPTLNDRGRLRLVRNVSEFQVKNDAELRRFILGRALESLSAPLQRALFTLLIKARASYELAALVAGLEQTAEQRFAALTQLHRLDPKLASHLALEALKRNPNESPAPFVHRALIKTADPAELESVANSLDPLSPAALWLMSSLFDPSLLDSYWPRAWNAAKRFEDKWHLLKLAPRVSRSAQLEPYLQTVFSKDEHWMLREAALFALVSRGQIPAAQIAGAALRDSYPRVRRTAAALLGGRAEVPWSELEPLTRDAWPLVRRAVVRASAQRRESQTALIRALQDASPLVREQAIASLSKRRAEEVTELVMQRLRDKKESTRVQLAALAFVQNLCVKHADDEVLAMLQRSARSSDAQAGELLRESYTTLRKLNTAVAHTAGLWLQKNGMPKQYLARFRKEKIEVCEPFRRERLSRSPKP